MKRLHFPRVLGLIACAYFLAVGASLVGAELTETARPEVDPTAATDPA
ncbi:MAG: hypothetical protein ACR2I1_07525 [Propionibacteriaceae bacterium]